MLNLGVGFDGWRWITFIWVSLWIPSRNGCACCVRFMFLQPVGIMDQVVLGLTFLILLRFTRQSLPPVLSAWRQYDVQYLDHLHEVMSPPCSAVEEARSYDVGLQAVKAIMATVHDFDTLRRSVPVLRDQWHRFLRSNPCPGPVVAAALRTLLARCGRTHITSLCVHAAGVQRWYLVTLMTQCFFRSKNESYRFGSQGSVCFKFRTSFFWQLLAEA